jgi:hypothetical protein
MKAILSAKTARNLQAHWIPQLRHLRQAREKTIKLCEVLLGGATIIAFFLFIAFAYIYLSNGKFPLELAPFFFIPIGIFVFAAVFLCRIQSCNDAIVKIECFVHLRDSDGLINALSEITCLAKLRELIDDFSRITATK